MKKYLIFLILLIPSLCWSAGDTYYISPDTDNSNDGTGAGTQKIWYKQGGWPSSGDNDANNTDIEACISAAAVGDVIVISGGASGVTYIGTALDGADAIDLPNRTLTGATTSGYDGTVTLIHDSDDTIQTTSTATVQNLTLKTNDANQYALRLHATTNQTVEDVIIDGGTQGIYAPMSGDKYAHIKRTIVRNTNDSICSYFGNGADGTGGVTLDQCMFLNNNGTNVIRVEDGDGLWILNSIFSGNTNRVLSGAATCQMNSIDIVNSIFTANTWGNNLHVIDITAGVNTTMKNTVVHPAPDDVSYHISGIDSIQWDGSETITSGVSRGPGFRANSKTGILLIHVDDQGNFDYWTQVADICDEVGFKATFYMSNPADMTSTEWTTLQTYLDNGHGISGHGYTHSRLDSLDSWQIQYTGGAAAATITIDTSNNSITTTTTGGVDDLTIDINNTSYDTVDEVVAYVDGQANYSASDVSPSNHSSGVSCMSLADVAGQDIKAAAYGCDLDSTRYPYNEIQETAVYIANNLTGVTVNTIGYPYNANEEWTNDDAKQYGMIGGRGTGTALTSGSTSFNLAELDVFDIRAMNPSSDWTLTDTVTLQRDVAGFAENLCENGFIYSVGCHNAGEVSIDQWRTIIYEFSRSNVVSMTLSEACEHIRGDSTGVLPTSVDSGDAEIYRRAWTDSSDYKLKSSSPLINRGENDRDGDGTNDSWTDFDERSVPVDRTADIGAYENALGNMQNAPQRSRVNQNRSARYR